jgi:hypothetical protein
VPSSSSSNDTGRASLEVSFCRLPGGVHRDRWITHWCRILFIAILNFGILGCFDTLSIAYQDKMKPG